MKIAILCLSPGIGGLELYAVREYQALSKRGLECLAIVAKGSPLAQRFREAQIEVIYLDVSSRRLPLLAAGKLASLLRHHRVDIVHMHWAKDLVLASLAKKRFPFTLVYTRHMEITRPKKDLLHRVQYRAVDRFLTITQAMREQALDYLPMSAEQIQCLYLGVRAPEGDGKREDFFADLAFPKRTLNLALFGRVEHGKGQHLLVEAVISLLEQGLDLSATLVGHVMDSGYQQKLQSQIDERKLGERIRFIDFIDQPIDSMGNFDVVLLTTYNETFGLVLPEAMRAGVAVIGSNAGGVPEIIDDGINGLLFEAGNSQNLEEAIKRYYQQPAFKERLADAGREKADRCFSEQVHFQHLYDQLCSLNS
ncbi:MAG: glycosyltransferase family 4 protein [Motiliproteus sp.]|nr:glycosyltransferase family 4 protein [Motiliproteus sp.]MCW9053763.1 glycosyltransferase family 4 protein [Motiliproteus sp.]